MYVFPPPPTEPSEKSETAGKRGVGKEKKNTHEEHSGIEELVALFPPFQSLNSLVMHLLRHFVVSLLLLLRRPTISDPLDMCLTAQSAKPQRADCI